MNKVVKVIFAILLVSGIFACKNNTNTASVANAKTVKFMVSGNCEQCQARIEKALAIDGVGKANWDVDSKIMTVVYDSVKVKDTDLHHAIAVAGHDTEREKAADKDYAALPECCQYTRTK